MCLIYLKKYRLALKRTWVAMSKTMGVAVFPCASGIGQEIFHALDGHKDVSLYGINAGENNAGSCLFGKRYIGNAPHMDDSESLISFLNTAFDKHRIEYIFPAYDDATVWLKLYERRLNVVVLAPNQNAVDICRSKTCTYKVLENVVRTPRIFDKTKLYEEDFPLFIKPDDGEGSKRCRKAACLDDAKDLANDEICIEYFPGEEYTVDCFTNNHETRAIPRIRYGVRAGLSVHTKPVLDKDIVKYCSLMAREIAKTLDMRGSWFFQCRGTEEGSLGLLEVAPRIAGAMALMRHAGVNFPLLTLYYFAGKPCEVLAGEPPTDVVKIYKNHVRITRWFSSVYCDLDDTLIKNGRVCPDTISFLYKWVGVKRIVLITRHAGDVSDTLNKYRISESLFDEVIHITDGSPKSKYVNQYSLFVDDSFSERKCVWSSVANVLCFDTDALNSFIECT